MTTRVIIITITTLAAVAGLCWWGMRPDADDPKEVPVSETAGFADLAAESGIDFEMGFLPGEQGAEFKINLYDHGCGVAVGDINGDGYDDIYFLNQLGANGLYQNKGDGSFISRTEEAGVALEDRVCNGATFADYDNDGDQDLFVTSTRGGNVLFRNRGEGIFEDVTADAGVEYVGHSQTAAFFDFDNDGYLDLYVVNTTEWTTSEFDESARYYIGKGVPGGGLDKVIRSPNESNLLYRNNRDGTFTNVSESSGLQARGWSSDAAVFDYNEDGRQDVYVASMFGPDQLFRNDGDGKFSDVTAEVLGQTSFGAIGSKVFDFDGDGRLDIIVVDMHSDMWMGLDYNHDSLREAQKSEQAKFKYFFGPYTETNSELMNMEEELEDTLNFRHEDVLFGNVLFRNAGNGRFEEVSAEAGVETFWPWGVATGDFDNDSDEDIFMACGMGYPFYYWPNYLMTNDGSGRFRNVAEELGIEPPKGGTHVGEQIVDRQPVRSSRCVATADFDLDGRLEIVTNNFNHGPYYYRNQLPKQNYIQFRLTGTASNRDAIGAVVTVITGDRKQVRLLQTAAGYLSQSTKLIHFGLHDAKTVDSVEILWPGGRRQTLTGLTLNTVHDIQEPNNESATVETTSKLR